MHHGLSGLSTYWLNDHRKGDEHPAYVTKKHGMLYPFTLRNAVTFINKIITSTNIILRLTKKMTQHGSDFSVAYIYTD